jgi:hypothetical protein
MTIRDSLNHRLRWFGGLMYGVFAIALGVALAGDACGIASAPFAAFGVGLALFMVTWLVARWSIKCPCCGHELLTVVATTGGHFRCSIARSIRFCPYCGVEIDTDFPVACSRDTE